MTTWEQLVRAYVAEGKRDWHDLGQQQKEALAIAFHLAHPLDMADAVFPHKGAALAILANITDHAHVGRMVVQNMVTRLGRSERIADAFEEACDEYDAMELRARREPDPDDELPAFLLPQAF